MASEVYTMQAMSKTEITDLSDEELKRLITKADIAYFDKDHPFLTDETYDLLRIELKRRDPADPLLSRIAPSSGSFKHDKPMLSLDKAYTEDEVLKWAQKIKGKIGSTPKLDGLALSLKYKKGELHSAVTRGDGKTGEEVTDTIKKVFNIPRIINYSYDVEIRGEAYLPFSGFDWISKNLEGKFENPRNLAAGAIKTKKETGSREDFSENTKEILARIKFEAYDVIGHALPTYQMALEHLEMLGFLTPAFVEGTENAFALWTELENNREKLDKPVDGIVLRADSFDEFENQGYTSHHPRGAIAYKFSSEIKETILEAVEWSQGRTGVLTPVGLVQPVRLSGVTVRRVTLHNLNRIKELDLSIGATVRMERSGDVIPTIIGMVKPGGQKIVPPKNCPFCNAPTQQENDFLMCTGSYCKGSATKAIEHFCKTVGIDGFGPAIIEQLYDAEVLRSFADLYTKFFDERFTVNTILGIPTADKLAGQIEKAKTVPMENFLAGMGIEGCGRSLSKKLTSMFKASRPSDLLGLPEFVKLNQEKIDGLGDVVTQSIADNMPKLREEILSLDNIVQLTQEAKKTGSLTGQSFVFTGTLPGISRSIAQKMVTDLGGECPSGVKKGLTYLVVGEGEEMSSKYVKAEKLGVKILSAEEFLKVISQ